MKKNVLWGFMAFVLSLLAFGGAKDAGAMEYKGYINKVFGYSLEYPDIFFDGTFEEDADKVVMESIHKKYLLKAWGRELKEGEDAKSLLQNLKADFEANGNVPIKHSEELQKDSFEIGYTDPADSEVLMAQYCVVKDGRAAFFVFRYPHDEYEVFGEILKKMGETFSVF